MAHLCGVTADYVTIEPDHERQLMGHVRQHNPQVVLAHEIVCQVLILFAGGLAADIREEMGYPDYGGLDEESDRAGIDRMLGRLSEARDERQRLWDEFEGRAYRILRRRAVWRAVENVAAELLKHRRLDCVPLMDTIQVSLGRSRLRPYGRGEHRTPFGAGLLDPPQWHSLYEGARARREDLSKVTTYGKSGRPPKTATVKKRAK